MEEKKSDIQKTIKKMTEKINETASKAHQNIASRKEWVLRKKERAN
jgi:hypothetical protein